MRVVRAGHVMRAAKVAIRNALAADLPITRLVPAASIFSVERATLPTLPAIELVSVASERTDRPLVEHQLSVEITVKSSSENGADEKLDAIVQTVRARLHAAESEADPIILPDGSAALVVLGTVRWSVSAGDSASTIRGAAIALACVQVDPVGGAD